MLQLQDLRYAVRVLVKSAGFTIVAVLSLALGIGANTAIFSLVDSLWTRPMAVTKPNQIVRLFSVTSQNPESHFSYPEYLEMERQANAFRGLVALGGRGTQMPNKDGTSELHTVNVVSENFFQVLGIQPLLGRLFTPADQPLLNRRAVIVLGNSCWKRRFGSDPSIVGKQIEFQRGHNLVLFTVLGVLPESFREINNGDDRDLWVPPESWARLSSREEFEDRGYRWFRLLGRLAPGYSVSSANAQVQIIAHRLATEWPQTNRARSARVMSDLSYRLEQAGTKGLVLLSVVLLLVLLSSVNVANLLLARSARRSKEIAVRLSLGAQRFRIVRQLMTENVLLGFGGMMAGLTLGAALIEFLPSLLVQPPALQPVLNFQLDSRVLAFTCVVSLLTVVLFGLAPAWKTSKSDLALGLKERMSSADWTGRGLQPRHWLSISQISISLALLTATGLLVQSFVNTRTLDFGLSRKPLLEVWMFASGPQAPALYREALNRVREFPSVKDVAFASRAPLSLSEGGMSQLVVFPQRPETMNQPVDIKYNSISSNYLQTIGTALRRGRNFDQVDQTTGRQAVLINETMARRFWPREDPINKIIRLKTANNQDYRIVGVVQNAPINEIGEQSEPYMYLPYWRSPTESMTFVISTNGNPLALAQPVRRKLISLSHDLDPFMITTQEELIHYSAGLYQITAELVTVLGFLGLMLTAVGLYGVISYGVAQRTREIGIRMALGAERSTVMKSVLTEVAQLGAIGVLLGLPLAVIGARSASALLFGVSPLDLTIFCSAVALLSIVMLAAGAVPAQRATRVDPMLALREE